MNLVLQRRAPISVLSPSLGVDSLYRKNAVNKKYIYARLPHTVWLVGWLAPTNEPRPDVHEERAAAAAEAKPGEKRRRSPKARATSTKARAMMKAGSAVMAHDLLCYHPRLLVYPIVYILTIYCVTTHAYPYTIKYIYSRFTLLPLTLTRIPQSIDTHD